MRKWVVFIAALVVVAVAGPAPTQSEDTGGMHQQVRRNMEASMNRLLDKGQMTTQKDLEKEFGKEKLEKFLEGSVARLMLRPDNTFSASSLAGGNFVSFTLGKKEFAAADAGQKEGKWLERSGTYERPRRAQQLTLTLRSGGRDFPIECYNAYKKIDQPVTYYVGPLDGLFCMGLVEGEGG